MWVVKHKGDRQGIEDVIVATEREAYDYVREFGNDYYYEWLSDTDYMKRKTKEWKRQQKLSH